MDISFKGVIPLVGEKGSLKTVKTELKRQLGEVSSDYAVLNVTDSYTKNCNRTGLFGLITPNPLKNNLVNLAVFQKKEILLLLTGKDTNKTKFVHHDPSVYINHAVISLDNLSEAVQKMTDLIKSKF
jgi:hypothetical protein